MSLVPLLLITLAFFAVAMLIMSVGVIFSNRCLRGSCGGSAVLDASGDPLTCATCPNRGADSPDRAAA
ncbi:MAG: hypothetical protein AAF772_08840 [Acidobacteriota bacterium]